MEHVKRCLIDQYIKAYLAFYRTKKQVGYHHLGQWLLSLIYLVNFFDINIYINIILILCAIVHKLYIDTYITDRLISMSLIFSTIFLKLFPINLLIAISFTIIVYDTFRYSKILYYRQKKLQENYHNIECLFMREHKKYLDNSTDKYTNIVDLNDDDNDDDDDDDENSNIFRLDDNSDDDYDDDDTTTINNKNMYYKYCNLSDDELVKTYWNRFPSANSSLYNDDDDDDDDDDDSDYNDNKYHKC